jgi:hypothetical protein
LKKTKCKAVARRDRGEAQRVVRGTLAVDMHFILDFGIR